MRFTQCAFRKKGKRTQKKGITVKMKQNKQMIATRKKYGISQETLGKLLGYKTGRQSTVSNIEQGKKQLSSTGEVLLEILLHIKGKTKKDVIQIIQNYYKKQYSEG